MFSLFLWLDRRVVVGAWADDDGPILPDGEIGRPVDIAISNPGRYPLRLSEITLIAPAGGRLVGGVMNAKIRTRLSESATIVMVAGRGSWKGDLLAVVPADAAGKRMRLRFVTREGRSGRRKVRTVTL